MAEVYASGNWHVTAGNEDAFIAAWRELLSWTTDNHQGLVNARLLREEGNASHFVSMAIWESEEARTAWRATDDFRKRLGACVELCDDFHGGDYRAEIVT